MLEKICEKYGFTYSKNYVVPSINKTYPDKILDEALLAKRKDGKEVEWLYVKDNKVHLVGNTDQMNIWLCDTRPDMTPERIIEFVKDLNMWLDAYNQEIHLYTLIDPEDWQEIANIPDASEDVRYTENGLLYADN